MSAQALARKGRVPRFGLGLLFVLVIILGGGMTAWGQPAPEWRPLGRLPGDAMLSHYFQSEVMQLRQNCLKGIETREDWQNRVEEYRRQLREMLGLDPLPAKSDLKVTITGTLERDDFRVEKLHFQSLPGLYVTANFYLPKQVTKPLPVVLYLCGHAGVKIDNVSYGNKTHYHFHAVWFARHGYACLVLDSLQLGEIEGIHHGTYRYGMWWWNNRGYTPAGVEAWNCVRALDYLQSRPEVDPERIGVTGRSGGGAYSWWIAAIDSRVKAAVPVAGITDLQNHVIDGCVEGHCDCMYFVNTYRWDYPMVAALVAPRALLIANGDHDPIFPEDGVRRVYEAARKVYRLYGAEDRIGLFITKAAHDDIPPIQEAAFRWLDKHLQGREREVYDPVVKKVLTPQELKVFEKLPEDQRNTTIHESFVPEAKEVFPQSAAEWPELRDSWRKALREKCFRGWPETQSPPALQVLKTVEQDGIRLTRANIVSQEEITLPIYRLEAVGDEPRRIQVEVLDSASWSSHLRALKVAFAAALGDDLVTAEDKAAPPDATAWQTMKQATTAEQGTVLVFVLPRGIGAAAWNSETKKRTQIERRFMLIGQTSDGMRVFDITQALQAIKQWSNLVGQPIDVRAEGKTAILAALAVAFEPVSEIRLLNPPENLRDGPYFLNISRYVTVPQVLLLVADKTPLRLAVAAPEKWRKLSQVAAGLGWSDERLTVIQSPQ